VRPLALLEILLSLVFFLSAAWYARNARNSPVPRG
jgi:uncharacterized membrane protein